MLELAAPISALLSAFFFLGLSDRRHWPSGASQRLRRPALAAGWGGLALSLTGFSHHFGIEVGAAWFLLWLLFAALAATTWLSLKPRTAPWAGGFFLAAALVFWVV
ncbi:MAG: DUF3325 family protein [Acidobacteriota bacterium]